jgi:RING finger/CHY zinc finger protein 1
MGCEHYERQCQLKAPCCGKWVPCRLCHDDERGTLSCGAPLDRKAVSEVKCTACGTEQAVSAACTECKVAFSEYFCPICRLYTNSKPNGVFHCESCGICRVGKQSDYFHCDKCNACFMKSQRASHTCIENVLDSDCPICLEVRESVNQLPSFSLWSPNSR